MNILQSKLYKEDIKSCLSSVLNIEELKNSKMLITGATGLVCSAIVDVLINADLDITVYAAGRSEEKVYERFDGKAVFVPYDATKPVTFDVDVDYVIHGASNASPNLYMDEPVETMQANIIGIQNLLEYAHSKSVKKVIYISSSEVYGRKESVEPFKEDQYGFIDLLNPRSSYSIAKRAAETMCVSYHAEYGVPFNVVRLGHIYGPSASRNDKRVSSDFTYRAAEGENLVLKSEGKQIRSYCYSLDCASAILSVLTSGIDGEAYNISNGNSIINIREMAEYLAESAGVELIFDIPNRTEAAAFNPMDNSSLDSSKLESLGWKGIFGAQIGLEHTIFIINEIITSSKREKQ